MGIIYNKIGYGYNDVTIVPASISEISSRRECIPFYDYEALPIFTAPMSTIVNEKNVDIWKMNHIVPMIPRNIGVDNNQGVDRLKYIEKYLEDGEWTALSLTEFTNLFVYFPMTLKPGKEYNVCVDLANGHMKELYETINRAKELSSEYGYKLTIMTGNIANPETYEWICENAYVDYVRVSIGSGAGCLTTSNTGVHYPIASLIDECYKIKQRILDDFTYHGIMKKSLPCIVADGGIRNYSDVIKALALGADYVMIGSLFASLLESASNVDVGNYEGKYSLDYYNGDISLYEPDSEHYIKLNIWDNNNLDELEDKKRTLVKVLPLYKEFYGMSTKKAQKLMGSSSSKTSEGCSKRLNVTHTIRQWTDNMISYLKSAMSYTNKRHIDDFVGKVDLIVNSANEIGSVNK